MIFIAVCLGVHDGCTAFAAASLPDSGGLTPCVACAAAASGMYYMAELVEEHTSLTRRIMLACNVLVLAVHVLFLIFESLPLSAVAVGLAAHACYFWMLQSFPFIQIKSPQFGASCGMLVATHYFWLTHFMNHFHSMMHVVCFFVLNVSKSRSPHLAAP